MKKLIQVGLLAFFVGGAVALPIQEAEAATRCRDVYSRSVHKRICTTTTRPAYRYRTVCRNYWRHGVKYRSCQRVRVYR